MLKTISSYFRSSAKINEFPDYLESSRTLFTSAPSLSMLQVFKLADLLNNNPKNYNANIKLLMSGVKSAKDWVIHMKFVVVLAYMLRNGDKRLAVEATNYLLSPIPRPNKSTPTKPSDVQSITQQVYQNILLNLRTYLLKVCQDLKVYHCLWRHQQPPPRTPACLLFKILNNCSYLLATKATFIKLFKGFDISELFSTLFKFVVEELVAWYNSFSGQLTGLVELAGDGEKEELGNLNQLIQEAEKLCKKTNLFAKMAVIFKIPVKLSQIRSVRVPVEFRINLQKAMRKGKPIMTHKESAERLRNILKIDSQQRTFAQDDMHGSVWKQKKSGRRQHSLNNSMMIHRQFRCD